MLTKIIEAIQRLFAALFGGGSGSSDKNKPTQRPTSTVSEKPKPVLYPQDGADTQENAPEVNQVSERVDVQVDPKEPDQEFEPVSAEDPEVFAKEENDQPIDQEIIVTNIEEAVSTSHTPRYLWCLDNGHGIKTKGKRSPFYGPDGRTQFREYEFNRDIVNRIIEQLEQIGVKYFNVVPEVDVADFLVERVERANDFRSALPKIYVSVHSNAGPADSENDWTLPSIKGIETWYFHGSKRGQKVASIFQKHLIAETGFVSRGLKSRATGQFYVIRKTRMTAILTENGFYNNQAECMELMTDEVRQKIADAHVKAILEIEKEGI